MTHGSVPRLWTTSLYESVMEFSVRLSEKLASHGFLVGALTTTPEQRKFSVQLIEGRSPFRIQGQRDRRAVSIRPLSASGWQQGQIHRRMGYRCLLWDAMPIRKSYERDELFGKSSCGVLGLCALTRLERCRFSWERRLGFPCLLPAFLARPCLSHFSA